jgi:DNA invertase Pin-like site-specific DNA recombinase
MLDTPTGRAMWQMIGVLAELERSLITERSRAGVKAAQRHRKERLGMPNLSLFRLRSQPRANLCISRRAHRRQTGFVELAHGLLAHDARVCGASPARR